MFARLTLCCAATYCACVFGLYICVGVAFVAMRLLTRAFQLSMTAHMLTNYDTHACGPLLNHQTPEAKDLAGYKQRAEGRKGLV